MDEKRRMQIISFPESDAQNARSARESGNLHAAKMLWDLAIGKDEKNPLYRLERAVCFAGLDEAQKALEDCEKSLELGYSDPGRVYFLMALCYAELDDDLAPMNALLYSEKAFKLHPDEEKYRDLQRIMEEKAVLSRVRPSRTPESNKVLDFTQRKKKVH